MGAIWWCKFLWMELWFCELAFGRGAKVCQKWYFLALFQLWVPKIRNWKMSGVWVLCSMCALWKYSICHENQLLCHAVFHRRAKRCPKWRDFGTFSIFSNLSAKNKKVRNAWTLCLVSDVCPRVVFIMPWEQVIGLCSFFLGRQNVPKNGLKTHFLDNF